MDGFGVLLIILACAIFVIVLLTAKFKVHPFFSLVIASCIVGVASGFSLIEILSLMQDGFGRMMRSLGFLIILGTTLGIILETNGSTNVMASAILRAVGVRNTAIAMSLTGFIVGLPIFCDSGFIVLSGLIVPLARKSGEKVATLAGCLATGLYAVHCLIPPHPGASAAAGVIGADFGTLTLYGIIVAIPAMLTGYIWSRVAGRKETEVISEYVSSEPSHNLEHVSVVSAFLPVVIPILLIGLKPIITSGVRDNENLFAGLFTILGEPVIALTIGILIALSDKSLWHRKKIEHVLTDSVTKAGGILIIIGGGGAFGALLTATKIGDHFVQVLPLASLGVLFPFLLTMVLKTAQGSSTVAIITAASIVQPLLPQLGLDYENGKILTVLAMGSGSMLISHANDAYFWVISNFERLPVPTMLRVYSVASLLMGLVSIGLVYILSFFL
jgi:gluconate:H+ symporter, GntP family